MRRLLLILGLGLGLPLAAAAQDAAPPGAAARGIVQQRLPDGRIVLTDRPLAGAETLRQWRFEPEDASERTAAEARRAAAQRESEAVTARIARQLERQGELDLQRELAWAAQDRSDRVLAQDDAPRYAVAPWGVGLPGWPWLGPTPPLHPPRLHPPRRHPPHLHSPHRPPHAARAPVRPGPVRPPRPGATPPPGPNPSAELPL